MCTIRTIVKPVISIEFVEVLQETAADTIKQCLEKLGASEEMITLLLRIGDLGYYLTVADKPGQDFSPKGFDIREILMETANIIADLGGTFDGPLLATTPRKGSFLDGFVEPGQLEELANGNQ